MSDIRSISLTVPYAGTVAAGTFVAPIMKIPGTSHGGGIYLVSADYSSPIAIGAGTAPAIRLVTLTSAGGVIATVGANGSAALTAGTPITGTISTPWISGTVGFLALEWGHEIAANNNMAITACVNYYLGRGSA